MESGPVVSAKQLAITEELIETEKNYVAFLKVIVDVFITPMRHVLTKAECSTLFSNIEALLEVNEPLLRDVELYPERVGHIFLERADLFKIYAVYCSNQPRITKTIREFSRNPRFVHQLEKGQRDPRCQYMLLSDLLVMPMQRITRYPLLLSALSSSMVGSDPQKAGLEAAIAKLRNIVNLINERTRQVEAIEQLVAIQSKIVGGEDLALVAPGRTCLHQGRLRFKKRLVSNLENPYAFLFNDMLILCSKAESSDDFIVKKLIPFDKNCSITAVDFESSGDSETIELSVEPPANGQKPTQAKIYKMKAFGKKEKDSWLKHFQSLSSRNEAAEEDLAQIDMNVVDTKPSPKSSTEEPKRSPTSDSIVPRLNTRSWRERRSQSRTTLDSIISPRESSSRLEKSVSVRLISKQGISRRVDSDHVSRRFPSAEGSAILSDSESSSFEAISPPERRHVRERSATVTGSPIVGMLYEESSGTTPPREITESIVTGAFPAGATASPPADLISSNTPVASPSTTSTKTRTKLNLRSLTQFAAAVLSSARGKKKDQDKSSSNSSTELTDIVDSPRREAESSNLTSESLVETRQGSSEQLPVSPPTDFVPTSRSKHKSWSRNRGNAISGQTLLADSRESSELAENPSDSNDEAPSTLSTELLQNALFDLLGFLVDADAAHPECSLIAPVSSCLSVRQAFDVLKSNGISEERANVVEKVFPRSSRRKSSHFTRRSVEVANAASLTQDAPSSDSSTPN